MHNSLSTMVIFRKKVLFLTFSAPTYHDYLLNKQIRQLIDTCRPNYASVFIEIKAIKEQ